MFNTLPLSNFSKPPENIKTCIIFGGSFDPIHEGHVKDIKVLVDNFDTVIIAPTSQNPWKEQNATPLDTRLKMIELVLEQENLTYSKNVLSSGLVLSSKSYNYSYELLEKIKTERSQNKIKEDFYWAVGEDLQDAIKDWKNWSTLGTDVITLPILEGYSSTSVRSSSILPHPALNEFLKQEKIYK